jgi:hypothetical protein
MSKRDKVKYKDREEMRKRQEEGGRIERFIKREK